MIKFLTGYFKSLGISARTAKTTLKSRVTSYQQHPYTWCKKPRQGHSYQVCKILGHFAVFKVHSMSVNLKIIFVCLVFLLLCFVWFQKRTSINQNMMFWGFFHEIYLILFISILSEPILDSERPRRGVNTSKLPVVSEGTSVVTTTPKSRVTTVEIVWATNWWDVLLSKYQWGEEDLFGSETGATLSRLPGMSLAVLNYIGYI